MIEITVICNDFDIDQLNSLFENVTEQQIPQDQTSRTRFFGDPSVTAAVIAAGSTTVGLVVEKVLSHMLAQRQQRLQEQLRKETTEVKIVVQGEGTQIEIIEKIPSKGNLHNRLSAILEQLENVKLDRDPKVEIVVVNDL